MGDGAAPGQQTQQKNYDEDLLVSIKETEYVPSAKQHTNLCAFPDLYQPLCQRCWHTSSWATSTGCHSSFSNRLWKCPKEIPGPVDNLEPLELVMEKCNRNEGETSRAEASSVTVSGELNVDGRRVGIPTTFLQLQNDQWMLSRMTSA